MKPIEAEIRATLDAIAEQVAKFSTHEGSDAYIEADDLASELVNLSYGLRRDLLEHYKLATLARVQSIEARKADQQIERMKG